LLEFELEFEELFEDEFELEFEELFEDEFELEFEELFEDEFELEFEELFEDEFELEFEELFEDELLLVFEDARGRRAGRRRASVQPSTAAGLMPAASRRTSAGSAAGVVFIRSPLKCSGVRCSAACAPAAPAIVNAAATVVILIVCFMVYSMRFLTRVWHDAQRGEGNAVISIPFPMRSDFFQT
jgi:hypothetical protein